MGSINAVATAAACLVAIIWWLSHKPNRTWLTFTAWWALFVALGTLWWIVPLLLLGKISPPFLDYIESAGVTTQWASLAEILRGTDSWTPFVSPERIAGASWSPNPQQSSPPAWLPPPASPGSVCGPCLLAAG